MPSWTSDDDLPFDPRQTPPPANLGILVDTFWRRPGTLRSDHPFAFAALGPAAQAITADPLPLPPHRLESPVGRVYEADGQVLLLGVGHDANTTVHLAEVMAGVPYGVPKYCTVRGVEGPIRVDYLENDHCCQRFTLVDDWLRAENLQEEATVGHASARLARSRDIVAAALQQLSRDPLLFLHPESAGCADCNEARSTVPD